MATTAVRYRFEGYDESADGPNVVVDGSPNAGTVLTLTHWPGQAQPPGTTVDTSAEMAFAHLDDPVDHAPAEVVTNNHFDQDGTVGLFALVEPETALASRSLLVDVAHAGDFGTYRDRRAARASMILHGFADPARSPCADRLTGDWAADAAALYRAALDELPTIIGEPERYRRLWAEEDESLSASEEAIASGRVAVAEDADLDLAVIRLDGGEPARSGHRFGYESSGPLHPMAVHNTTTCTRLLLAHVDRYLYVDRYETWVQLRSRTPPSRVDLRPLADELSAAESQAGGGATWTAGPPSALTPELTHDGGSALAVGVVEAAIRRHLSTAPVAWDPYRPKT
ncbi:MAG: DUF6687 family protein [Actinomycetota bacterium]